ncbi:hypothetical protein BKA56DRAFT_19303 [Ilyonectria sp. MPI-CAGE-AT-0026]|nr:hypothetical protein BKA56DRAFT_19303 [Ilyonectria sp. MPI-CAGE-AT-0026]
MKDIQSTECCACGMEQGLKPRLRADGACPPALAGLDIDGRLAFRTQTSPASNKNSARKQSQSHQGIRATRATRVANNPGAPARARAPARRLRVRRLLVPSQRLRLAPVVRELEEESRSPRAQEPRSPGAQERPNFASPHWLDLTNPLSVARGYRCPKPGPGRTEQTREDQTRPWVAQTRFLCRPSPSHMAPASLLLRHGPGRRCSTYGSGSGRGSTASHLGHRCPEAPRSASFTTTSHTSHLTLPSSRLTRCVAPHPPPSFASCF